MIRRVKRFKPCGRVVELVTVRTAVVVGSFTELGFRDSITAEQRDAAVGEYALQVECGVVVDAAPSAAATDAAFRNKLAAWRESTPRSRCGPENR